MRLSRPSDIKKTVLAAIDFLILIGTGSIIFETCRHTQTGDMEGYVETFSRKMAETNAGYKPIADDISRARDEKTYYRCLYRLDRRMFENGDQTRAFEFLRQCLMLIKSDKSPSQEKKRFEIHCYLMLGSASDETGLRSMSHSYYFEGLKKIDAYGIGELRGDFLNRQKTEALSDYAALQQKLLEISQRDRSLRDSIKSMIATLTTLKADAQWDEFHYYFDNVHPGFYARLDSLHPGLTQKDRRLCALISLGLSTKEIAGITFREVRSVETSRTRLRKKLGLESDSLLNEYITGLARTASGSGTVSETPAIQVEQAMETAHREEPTITTTLPTTDIKES